MPKPKAPLVRTSHKSVSRFFSLFVFMTFWVWGAVVGLVCFVVLVILFACCCNSWCCCCCCCGAASVNVGVVALDDEANSVSVSFGVVVSILQGVGDLGCL